jgi:hypothetical protein
MQVKGREVEGMNSTKFGILNPIAVIALALLGTTAVMGQSAPPPPAPPHDMMMMHGPGPGGGMMAGEFGEGKTITGSPLSGDIVTSRDTTLADGNRIHNESTTKVYRDAQGRVRRDVGVDLATPATGNVKRSMVVISDPLAGKRYMLNPDNKTAREMPMHGPKHQGEEHMKAMGGPAEPGPITKEQMGTKSVNGIQAEGVRVTRTIPAGAIGNDKPIEVVTERWYSTDLQIAVMTVHTDPMMGTVTTKLVNVTRGDPDASLFQVPSDYKVEVGKPNEPMYMPMKP